MNTAKYRPGSQRGLTLVELMVSITVGLILVGALAFYFAGQKQTYSYQDSLISMQDSARTAFLHIGRDLRLAGYYGCVPQGGEPVAANANANIAPPAGTYSRFVRDVVTQQGTTPNLAAGFELAVMGQDNADPDGLGDANEQSDRLVINIADPLGLAVAQMDSPVSPVIVNDRADGTTAAAVLTDANVSLAENRFVAVADCEQAAAFYISGITPVAGGVALERQAVENPTGHVDLQHIYGSDKAGPAELLELRRVRYYIDQFQNNGGYSLYRCSGYTLALGTGSYCPAGLINEELVSNVDAMQIKFGIADSCNNDGTANYSYVDALAVDPERNGDAVQRNNALLQTARAVAVQVTLTLRAPGIVNDDFTVDDDGNRGGAYRRPFSTVVELRNGCRA